MDNIDKIIIGIDNGLDGALVALRGSDILKKIVMPVIALDRTKRDYDPQGIKRFFDEILETINRGDYLPSVILEKAQAMPKQGVSSTFKIGKGFGLIEGILVGMGIRYTIIHPRTWQKEVLRDIIKGETKQSSILIAQRLWPSENWLATDRSKKPHIGLTDAACIAEYGNRIGFK